MSHGKIRQRAPNHYGVLLLSSRQLQKLIFFAEVSWGHQMKIFSSLADLFELLGCELLGGLELHSQTMPQARLHSKRTLPESVFKFKVVYVYVQKRS